MLDVLIIGSGPHALTLASFLKDWQRLITQPPSSTILEGIVLSKSQTRNRGYRNAKKSTEKEKMLDNNDNACCLPLNVKVVDTYGEWVTLWDKQFCALNIPHLRSHTLVHTDPSDKKALQKFVVNEDRTNELHCLPETICIQDENAFFNDSRLGKKDKKKLSSNPTLRKSLYFSLPSTELIMDFFKDQVRRYQLENNIITGTVEKIIPVLETCSEPLTPIHSPLSKLQKQTQFFQVVLQNGTVIQARHVVLATGPTRCQMANIPTWVKTISESYPEDRLQHTAYLIHAHSTGQDKQVPAVVCQMEEKIMVVGGGLTSAHIIHLAFQQGAHHVVWVLRKHLQLKQFDVGDIETLVGRYSHKEHGIKLDGLAYLRQFYSERSLYKRLNMIRQARKGSAVTPEAYQQLKTYLDKGCLVIKSYCQVSDALWSYKEQEWNVSLSTKEQWKGDRIWLATGCKLDVTQDPLLSNVMKEFPIQVLDGWPAITEDLQWAPGCDLYLMGQYAALQIGPHAVNLAGGQAATARIAKVLHKKHDPGSSEWKSSKEKKIERNCIEDYIQQMWGLMWL
ncbi:uncharacterized protein LOC122803455 [Protopterus annectens]|uniref:uncharacterized protein LOC122803455 n=1 Tax=Protopterus annectens TaxID=7888 RepID=UPI001CFA7CB5|nr:uncharacterized protein LOC122803455 [Protopterus annectens]